MKDYEESSIKGTDHLPPEADSWQKATQISSNPLLSYRMIRRFSNEFDVFGAHLNQYLEGSKSQLLTKRLCRKCNEFQISNPKSRYFCTELVDRVNKLGGAYGFPADRDHNEAMDALMRVQYVYDLKADDVRTYL
jgi:hypothetical protein